MAEPILRAITACGYQTPTPIQAQAIPSLLLGRDILGIAQTGTGKTAAFVLPILDRLTRQTGQSRAPRALILAPTRELAVQIGADVHTYGKHTGLRHTVVFGGVKDRPQIAALARGVDVVIATPGRLLDLLRQRKVDLRRIECFVLDEADRMLDMGFIDDIRTLVADLPAQRQSLMFSATMRGELSKLANGLLQDPLRVEVAPQATPIERIAQSVHHVTAADKLAKLAELLGDQALSKVIVFTRTKHRADRVAEHLVRQGIEADAMHGNKSQAARQRALKGFRVGRTRVLVATDIAARGIDVDAITHVINFELPHEAESYVHRIGRTARAGASGTAISLCDPSERGFLASIERATGVRLTQVGAPPEPAAPVGKPAGRQSRRPSARPNPGAAPAKRRQPRQRRRAA
ncbi:MAG: DEAD/DEAH box helicase [Geminicoccaceae bacterium]